MESKQINADGLTRDEWFEEAYYNNPNNYNLEGKNPMAIIQGHDDWTKYTRIKNGLLENYKDELTEPNFESNYISFSILEKDYINTITCEIDSFFVSKDDRGHQGQWYKFYAIIEDIKTEEEAVNFLYEKGKKWCFSLPKTAFTNACKAKHILKSKLKEYPYIKIKFYKKNSKTLVIKDYEFLNKEIVEKFEK